MRARQQEVPEASWTLALHAAVGDQRQQFVTPIGVGRKRWMLAFLTLTADSTVVRLP